MAKILAFSGSNSSTSINQKLVEYVAKQVDAEATVIDLRDYNAPLFSEDLMKEGIPPNIEALHKIMAEHDGFVISSPEYNGGMTSFLKNTLDWMSISKKKFLGEDAPVLLLSTAPGAGGGGKHLGQVEKILGYFGGVVKGQYSLSFFNDHFKDGTIITQQEKDHLQNVIAIFKNALKN